MAKPKGTVEIRIFVTPEKRNEIKSIAASQGKVISDYFVQLHDDQSKSKKQVA